MSANLKTASELGFTPLDARGIPDLVGAAYGLDALLLHEADFSAEFLNLKTGLLGELFQKLVNYQIRTAVVIPNFDAHGERFSELAHEHARHPHIRFFTSEAEARSWLQSLP